MNMRQRTLSARREKKSHSQAIALRDMLTIILSVTSIAIWITVIDNYR
jgi:hypothetical protein